MILDTTALAAIVDRDRSIEPALRPGKLAIPVVVLGEFRFGIAQSQRRHEYVRWLNANLPDYDVLGITEMTTVQYAQIRLERSSRGRRSHQMILGSRRCAANTAYQY